MFHLLTELQFHLFGAAPVLAAPDAAPRVSELGRAAILAADMVLVPVMPSPLDVWASSEVVRLDCRSPTV